MKVSKNRRHILEIINYRYYMHDRIEPDFYDTLIDLWIYGYTEKNVVNLGLEIILFTYH